MGFYWQNYRLKALINKLLISDSLCYKYKYIYIIYIYIYNIYIIYGVYICDGECLGLLTHFQSCLV